MATHRSPDLDDVTPSAIHSVLGGIQSLPCPNPVARANRKTLLVVEDDRSVCESLGLIFSDEYQVLYAYDGPLALAMTRERQPDAVLLDLGLPRMSGFAVLA